MENGADELRRKFHIDVLGSFSVIKVKWIPRTWGCRIHGDLLGNAQPQEFSQILKVSPVEKHFVRE